MQFFFAQRVGRPNSVSAVPVGPGIDIGSSCRFLGSLIRFLALLPGGLIRFLPCRIGANHCILRHLGWEKCGHGLTSRPRETSHPGFLDSLFEVFGYPEGSGGLLLSGELPLWFCSGNFALRKPSWSLPDCGWVQALLSERGPDLGIVEFPAARSRERLKGCWIKGAGGTWKRMRLTKKTASSLVRGHGVHHVLHGVRWKRLRSPDGVLGFGARSDKRGRFSLHERGFFPREGVG